MNVIHLDMSITADEALAAHDALPQSALKQKRDAYWRRYSRIKSGIRDACTYTSSDEAQHATPPAAPTDRVDMIRRIAQRGESAPVRTLAPMPTKPAEKTKATPPWCPPKNPRSRAGIGRVAEIPAALAPAIHKRINQLAMDLGYGDVGGFGVKPVWGGASQFARAIGVTSSSTYHDTVHTGKKVWPKVIDGIVQCLGVSREWLLHGTGVIYTDQSRAIRFAPRATKAPPRKPSRFAEPPQPDHGPPTKCKDCDAADAMTQPLIKRPPGGVLFDPIAFNVDQTFSILGAAAFTSRFTTQNAEVRDGGPVASDSARDATPPFSAPTG